MPTIALRSIGMQGLQKDSMQQDVPASGITTGQNVRIKDNALTSWAAVIEQVNFLDTEELLFADGIYRERSLLSGLIVVLADETLMAFDGGFSDAFNIQGQVVIYFYDTNGIRINISPTSPLQTTEQWNGVRVGEIYILNNAGADLPHIWFVNENLAPNIVTDMDISKWTGGANTFTDVDPDEISVLYVDTALNVIELELTGNGSTSEDVIVGEDYEISGQAMIDTGSVTLKPQDGGAASVTLVSTVYVNFTLAAVPTSATTFGLQVDDLASGETVHIKNLKLRKVIRATAFTIMPGWPTNYRARFMNTFNNVIVAGGLIQDGVDVHYRIKWSHPVSPGDTTTFWDFTDPTILAGESPLVTNAREMVALSPLKDLMMIYFDHSVFRMSFVGGQFVMSFEQAFTDDGAVSSRSMVSVDGMAYVFGYNDVYSHDGYIKSSITDKRMTRFIQNSINPERPVDVVFYSLYNELQFLVRTPSRSEPVDGDRIFIYNLIHNAWTEADVSDNNVPAIGLLFTGPSLISDGNWNQITLNWDNAGALTWAGAFQSPERDKLYALSKLNHVIYDWSPDGFGLGAAVNTFSLKTRVEHTHIDMDDGGEAVGNKIVYVNRVYPQIQGFGTVQFRFGVHETAQAPVEWIETRLFKISKVDQNDPLEEAADYACDLRMAGRYIAYELTILEGAEFTFGGLDIEIALAGEV